jgi:hypothetical protein
VDQVAAAAAQGPSCWSLRVDGIYVFNPTPAVAYLNAVVDRALADTLPPAAAPAAPAAAPAPAEWLTANMTADQRAQFLRATGLAAIGNSERVGAKPAVFNKAPMRHLRVQIEDQTLAKAIMDTYVGPRAVNTTTSQELRNFWKNYTKGE